MLIGFDASRAFISEATGTENYSLNLLRALAKFDRRNKYRVYLRDSQSRKSKWRVDFRGRLYTHDFDFRLPNNFELKIIRPRRLWTQVGLASETWRNPVDVLFVPAHTLPILRRRKIGEFKIFNFLFDSKLAQSEQFKINFFAKQTKYVVTMHDLGVEFLPGYHSFPGRYYLDLASKYAARTADSIIAVSEATKRDLIRRYKISAEKIHVVHEGVDTGFFRRESKSKVESVKDKYKIRGNYVLYVGTVQPRKNLEMLIRAFGEFLSQSRKSKWKEGTKAGLYTHDFDLSLMIAGKPGWNFQQIIDLPKKLGMKRAVKFLGYVDRADLPALYSGAAVFAFPSLFEGFGLPILEALSCGCPVVASDIAPHREIFAKIAGSATTFPPASARSKLKLVVGGVDKVELRAVGSPSSRVTRKPFDIGNYLKFEIPTFTKVGMPMVLAKPKDIDQWSSFLYQYVSQYDKRLSIGTKFRSVEAVRATLATKFNWEEVARQTLKVIEGVLR